MNTSCECVIYDFETLSQDQSKGVVLSFAMLSFSEKRYVENPYTFEELIDSAKFIKFDVRDQVENYGRKISKETLDWWNERGEKAKKQLAPSKDDKLISTLFDFISESCDLKSMKKSFTRGNTFDPLFLQHLMKDIGKIDPFHWKTVRDTRSMIEGMAFGMEIDNGFDIKEVMDKFVKHDPRHDIALDVLRMQSLARAILN